MDRFWNTLPGTDTTRMPNLATRAPVILSKWDEFAQFIITEDAQERSEYAAKYPTKP